jgi:hypothetical protein
MSEARFENVLRELKSAAPPAPEELRERVRNLPEPARQPVLRLRPALAAAIAIAIAVGIGAAAIGGLRDSTTSPPRTEAVRAVRNAARPATPDGGGSEYAPTAKSPGTWRAFDQGKALTGSLPPGSRLQDYNVSMRARVEDLSDATKSAIRTTRTLGGYVAGADYATDPNAGDSRLDLRVPVQNVQRAIGSFTELGTILAQRISVADLQEAVDRFDQRRSTLRQQIAELEAKEQRVGLTPAEQAKLNGLRRNVTTLSKARTGLVRQGAYAKISLQLTSRKPAAKSVEPGRFGRFWDNAGDILGKELIAVLYALVVAGPFLLLAALALLGERMRRRRADSRLLEETA